MSDKINIDVQLPAYAIKNIESIQILTAYGLHNKRISLFVPLDDYIEALQKLDDAKKELEFILSKTTAPTKG